MTRQGARQKTVKQEKQMKQIYYQIMSCNEDGNRDSFFQDMCDRRQMHSSPGECAFEILYPWQYTAVDYESMEIHGAFNFLELGASGVIKVRWYEWSAPDGSTKSVPARHPDAPLLIKEAVELGAQIESKREFFVIEEVKRMDLRDKK